MARFAVNISDIPDETLSFFGYEFQEETDEFKIYIDKYREPHIVQKARPLLYVEDINDSVYLASSAVIALPDDLGD
jgi:hypothetical protein